MFKKLSSLYLLAIVSKVQGLEHKLVVKRSGDSKETTPAQRPEETSLECLAQLETMRSS